MWEGNESFRQQIPTYSIEVLKGNKSTTQIKKFFVVKNEFSISVFWEEELARKRKDGAKMKALVIKLKHYHEKQIILPVITCYKQGVLSCLPWKVLAHTDRITMVCNRHKESIGKGWFVINVFARIISLLQQLVFQRQCL